MGYAYSTLPTQLEIGGTPEILGDITTVSNDIACGSVYCPQFPGYTISKAYGDLQYHLYYEDSNLLNYLENDTAFVAERAGSTTTALTLPAGSLRITAGHTDNILSGMRYYGKNDIVARVAQGNTTTFYLNDAVAHHDHIHLMEIYPIIRLILKGGVT